MNTALRVVMVSAVAAVALVVAPSRALAQLPPSGWIYDLATAYGTSTPYPSTYQAVSGISFVADTTGTEYVSFAFRQSPAYFSFDDACVSASSASLPTSCGGNMLTDPGFESDTPSNVGTNFPVGWDRWIQPIDTSAIGVVAGNGNNESCGYVGPNTGSYFWCDGSVQGYDALYQPVSVTLGHTYYVSLELADTPGYDLIDTSGDGIDVLVYAGDQIPVGTQQIGGTVPEPSTLVTLSTGLLSLAGFARRRFARNS
jgi:hypothetical protein